MCIEGHPMYCHGRYSESITNKTENNESRTRNKEQPARAVHQKKPQRTPAVTKCPQMGCVRTPTVGMECCRHFCDTCTIEARLDDHLSREFHSCASQIQTLIEIPREPAQAAIHI